MLRRFFDLRFVIGAFFLIIGLLLFVYSFLAADDDGQGINHFCGLLFIAFGIVMMWLSKKTDATDKVLEAKGEMNDEKPE